MRTSFIQIAILFLGLSISSIASPSHLPQNAFSYPQQNAPVFNSNYDENKLKLVFRALENRDRDRLLLELGIPTIIVAGEKWFDLRGATFNETDLSSISNLSRVALDYCVFKSVNISNISFNSAVLRGAVFRNSTLINADFGNSHLQDSDFEFCEIQNANFVSSTFSRNSSFRACNLNGANLNYLNGNFGLITISTAKEASFVRSNFKKAKFIEVDLTGSNFESVNLNEAVFKGAIFDNVNFTDAWLHNARLDGEITDGIIILNRSRIKNTFFADIDFGKIDLSYLRWDGQDYYIGEERFADDLDYNRWKRERNLLYSRAEIIYRSLSEKYKEIGYTEEYLRLKYRRFEARRKYLMSSDSRDIYSTELKYLHFRKWFDEYGTSIGMVFNRYLWLIGIFAMTYYIYIIIGRDRLVEISYEKAGADAKPKKKKALMSKLILSIYLSLGGSLAFAQKVFDYEAILELFMLQKTKIELKGIARVTYGIEALLGLGCFYYVVRAIVERIG